jgi:glycosyltransferase involved in cell wall biosynthesis
VRARTYDENKGGSDDHAHSPDPVTGSHMRTGPIRVVALATAPFHYHAALYRALAAEPTLEFSALFCSKEGLHPHDGGYGQPVQWDTDLVEGYVHRFLARADKNPFEGRFFTLRDWDVVAAVRRERPEVLWIHNYSYLTLVLAALTQWASGGTVAFRGDHTLLVPRPRWKRTIKSVVLPLLFRRSFGLYSGTQSKRWMQKYGTPADRLVFAPMSIDNAELQRQARDLRPNRAALRQAFGLREEQPTILFVGRLVDMKQPMLLVEAFSRVRRHAACSLLIVGTGPLEQAMRQRIVELAVPDVHFAGFLNRSRIGEAYVASDILVLPSDANESWGLVINEAMNFQLPVVISSLVACGPDLVRPGETGYVVSPIDPEDLAQKLSELVLDPQLRQQFGVRALQVVDRWGVDATVAGVLSAVRLAVGAARWARAEFSSPRSP